jgi:phosphate starvation-inducible PhoH-like protein
MGVKKLSNIQLEPHSFFSIKFKERKLKFTENQHKFLDILLNHEVKIKFVSGPSGSSKTYMSLYGCLRLMSQDQDKDLLYVLSIVESAEKCLGSLPGDMSEKFNPFTLPLYDKLEEIIHEGDTAYLKQKERVNAIPINFLRGANWENKLIVADEAQNFTFKELTTLITRIGENTKLIICGDFMKSYIDVKTVFKKKVYIFSDYDSTANGIDTFKFTNKDIVRSKILKFIISKLENWKKV